MQRTCMPPSGAPCCVGMENRSSDSAMDGCAGLLDAAVLPAAAPGAPKACTNGSALCCMDGAALGAGELSCAKGSDACMNTTKPLRESIIRRHLSYAETVTASFENRTRLLSVRWAKAEAGMCTVVAPRQPCRRHILCCGCGCGQGPLVQRLRAGQRDR